MATLHIRVAVDESMMPESETASHDALATIYGHDDKIDLTLEFAKAVLAINPS
tara:strand:- start:40687 stop:40845 length:159 start_codon:yes stop_codon:yes gene_type:complete